MIYRIVCLSLLALLFAHPPAQAGLITYTNNTDFPIPNEGSASSSIVVSDPGALTNVSVTFTFNPVHPFVGDVTATLTHNGGSGNVQTIELFSRPGDFLFWTGLDNSNIAGPYTFTDSASEGFESEAGDTGNSNIPAGSYKANGSFISTFGGKDGAGTWTLKISDSSDDNGTGTLTTWSLSLTTASVPTASTPEPASLTLLCLGGLGLAGAAWRRRAQKK